MEINLMLRVVHNYGTRTQDLIYLQHRLTMMEKVLTLLTTCALKFIS